METRSRQPRFRPDVPSNCCCYIAGVFPTTAPIHWLVHGHLTSNNETVSRQMPCAGNIAKQFTVTHEMLNAVARDQSVQLKVASQESQRVFQNLLLFCFAIEQIT